MELFDSTLVSKDTRVLDYIKKVPSYLGSWSGIMSRFINSDHFYIMMNDIFKEAWSGKKVFPKSSEIFRAFEECNYDNLKVVFVLQDPYHQFINGKIVADGLAMSCSHTGIEQPSLKLVYDEIERTAYHYKWVRNPDLKRWANQGILLLNTALTVERGKADSHSLYWKNYTNFTLKTISDNNENLIFVFFGRKAQEFSYLVSSKHHKFNVIHPAAAAYTKSQWDSKGLFPKINEILENSLKDTIVW